MSKSIMIITAQKISFSVVRTDILIAESLKHGVHVYKLFVEYEYTIFYTMPFMSRMLCPISFEGGMPYALDFPANEVGSHENVCHFIEYALPEYMPYMGVDCSKKCKGKVLVAAAWRSRPPSVHIWKS